MIFWQLVKDSLPRPIHHNLLRSEPMRSSFVSCPSVVQRAQAKPALPEAKLSIKPPVHTMEVATPQIDSAVPTHCLLHKAHVQPAVVVTQMGSCAIKCRVSIAIRCMVERGLPQGRAHTNKMHTPNARIVVRSQLATLTPARAD